MRAPPLLAVLGAVLLGGLWFAGHDNLSIPLAFAAEEAVLAPKPQVDAQSQQKLENAVFAGGCFWGVEGVFSHVRGVRQAVSGYRGAPGRQGRSEGGRVGKECVRTCSSRWSPVHRNKKTERCETRK